MIKDFSTIGSWAIFGFAVISSILVGYKAGTVWGIAVFAALAAILGALAEIAALLRSVIAEREGNK